MDKEIEELVEFVAKQLPALDRLYKWGDVGELIQERWRTKARRILSHPDLYVKVKKTPLEGYAYYQYIPLAEALKEE